VALHLDVELRCLKNPQERLQAGIRLIMLPCLQGAMNETGYLNLMALSSQAYFDVPLGDEPLLHIDRLHASKIPRSASRRAFASSCCPAFRARSIGPVCPPVRHLSSTSRCNATASRATMPSRSGSSRWPTRAACRLIMLPCLQGAIDRACVPSCEADDPVPVLVQSIDF
jgi:hypothetical protein